MMMSKWLKGGAKGLKIQNIKKLGFEHWVLYGPLWPKKVGFCDLLGTPYAPVSKIPPVKSESLNKSLIIDTLD